MSNLMRNPSAPASHGVQQKIMADVNLWLKHFENPIAHPVSAEMQKRLQGVKQWAKQAAAKPADCSNFRDAACKELATKFLAAEKKATTEAELAKRINVAPLKIEPTDEKLETSPLAAAMHKDAVSFFHRKANEAQPVLKLKNFSPSSRAGGAGLFAPQTPPRTPIYISTASVDDVSIGLPVKHLG
jgi:hypothetical protein